MKLKVEQPSIKRFFIPHYNELALYIMSLAFVLIFFEDADLRTGGKALRCDYINHQLVIFPHADTVTAGILCKIDCLVGSVYCILGIFAITEISNSD